MTTENVAVKTSADALSVIIDADDYFTHARSAMLQAQRRIMLIGWDFDARVRFGDREKGDIDNGPETIGDFLYWLVKRTPTLEVCLLRWDTGALKTLFRGSSIFTLAKWMAHPRIHTKLDKAHPFGGSHHQKLVLIDDSMAFCGGIDVTGLRWDTREHNDDDPRRCFPGKKRYTPWHDASSAISGPVVSAIADACYKRWRWAKGKDIRRLKPSNQIWPKGLKPNFENVPVSLAQTLPKMPNRKPVYAVEDMYLQQIARAKRHIYIESQYFCSRTISEALAKRLAEPDGPEVVVINPDTAEGWLEPVAMDSARARVVKALMTEKYNARFRMYHPVTKKHRPIYVHAKIMIIDDLVVRLGSANLNNRSMRLDSECDIAVTLDERSAATAKRAITHIRNDLLAEHLGCGVATVVRHIDKSGSIISAIESIRGKGKTLVPYVLPDIATTKKWLADNEVLDPNGPDEMFEAFAGRGLFSGRLRLRRH